MCRTYRSLGVTHLLKIEILADKFLYDSSIRAFFGDAVENLYK